MDTEEITGKLSEELLSDDECSLDGDMIDYTDPDDIEDRISVKYTWDDLLEMFCGTEYYSRDELLYTYLKVNGFEDEAQHVMVQIARNLKQNKRKCLKRLRKRSNTDVPLPAIEESKDE